MGDQDGLHDLNQDVPSSGPIAVPRPPMTSIVTSTLIGVSPITDGEMLWS